jgi:hypothetical protein
MAGKLGVRPVEVRILASLEPYPTNSMGNSASLYDCTYSLGDIGD